MKTQVLTVAGVADAFLTDRDFTHAASTVARDYQILRNCSLDFLGLSPAEVTTADLWQVVTKWGGSLGTKKRVRTTLMALARYMHLHGHSATNPGADLPVPVAGKPERQGNPLPWGRVPEIVSRLHPAYQGLVLFAAHTGLRWGELRALTVADLRLDGDVPHVVVGKSKSKNYPLKEPKAGRARMVPLDLVAFEIADRSVNYGDPNDLVFTSPRGFQIAHTGFYRDSRWRLEARGHTFHDLRHTAAVHWLSIPEVAEADIQRWLGHNDLTTTQRYLSGLAVSRRDHALLAALNRDVSRG